MREYLIALRKERKMSQTEVAEEMKISQQMYAFIEKGVRPRSLSVATLNKLSVIFDVPMETLVVEEKKLINREESL